MKFFAISFIHFAVASEDQNPLDHAMETIYLVACRDEDDVLTIAREIGVAIEHEYRNMDDRLIRWQLGGLRTNELQDLTLPVRLEVFSRFMSRKTAQALLEDY
jgi:hypothetical protein